MNEVLNFASRIANEIPGGQILGHICLFDIGNFMGILPIRDWNQCFQAALRLIPYESAAIIVHDTLPPLIDLQAQAAACNVTYCGAIYDRPIRLIEPETDPSPPAPPARLLH